MVTLICDLRGDHHKYFYDLILSAQAAILRLLLELLLELTVESSNMPQEYFVDETEDFNGSKSRKLQEVN